MHDGEVFGCLRIPLLCLFAAVLSASAQTNRPPVEAEGGTARQKVELRRLLKIDELRGNYIEALQSLQKRYGDAGKLDPVLELRKMAATAKEAEDLPAKPETLIREVDAIYEAFRRSVRAANITFAKQEYTVLKAEVERLDTGVRNLTRANRLEEAKQLSESLKQQQADLVQLTADLKKMLSEPANPREGRIALLRQADLYFACNRMEGNVAQGLSKNRHRGLAKDIKVVAGKHGGAYYFNGKTSGIRLDPKPWGEAGPLTLALWVRGADAGGLETDYSRIIHKMDADRKASGFLLSVGRGSSVCAVRFDGKQRFAQNSPRLENNQWIHIALTFDGDQQATLYIDGERQRDMFPRVPWISFGPDQFYLGRRAAGQRDGDDARPFMGAIDEFTLFKRELSEAEIQLLSYEP